VTPRQSAADIIRALTLSPHPEGGHYRETFRDPRIIDGRAASTSIYFLLARGERSHWHRIDAVEIWHYYAGAALKLEVVDGAKEEIVRLGADIHGGEVPQFTVPARVAGGGILRRLDAGGLHGGARFFL
jgi:predicted cupin superfamily sugar epimerase